MDEQMVISLILLHLSGGESVDDMHILEGDEGFAKIMRRVETYGKPRSERRAFSMRWRKERRSKVPSPSSVFRYLEAFHEPKEDEKRELGKAFIP